MSEDEDRTPARPHLPGAGGPAAGDPGTPAGPVPPTGHRPSRRELREAAARAAAADAAPAASAEPGHSAAGEPSPPPAGRDEQAPADEHDEHVPHPDEPAGAALVGVRAARAEPDDDVHGGATAVHVAHLGAGGSGGETRAPAPPFLWVVLGAVLIAVSLAILWGASQRVPDGTGRASDVSPTGAAVGGTLAGEGSAREPTSGTAEAPTAATPAIDDATIAQAMLGLQALPTGSDCTNLSADAQVVHTYADTLLVDGAWPDLPTSRLIPVTLDELAAACAADYAQRLAQYLASDPAAHPAVVTAVRAHHDVITLARPAPEGAVADEAFRTASGNIRCTITHDGAGCAILVRSFENPPGCTTPTTGALSVALFGDDVLPCVGTVEGGPSQLEVGATSAVGDYACTNDGASVTCWHTVSGAGFTLSPEALTEL
ncbi:hypothetical protein [Georgenia wangjunii]|uniref:hypothetical protein n=1 Tax=Georgenia wangjunii TaxID=3117730 RepID=UPI002F25FB58